MNKWLTRDEALGARYLYTATGTSERPASDELTVVSEGWRGKRPNRKISGLFVGSAIIPIGPRIARQLVPGGADLQRLNSGTHPILIDHRAGYCRQYGRVIKARATGKGIEGQIEIFGYDEDTLPAIAAERERIHQMLDDGCGNLSIGTRLYESELVEVEGMGDLIRTSRWEPDELSLVAIGASRPARLSL